MQIKDYVRLENIIVTIATGANPLRTLVSLTFLCVYTFFKPPLIFFFSIKTRTAEVRRRGLIIFLCCQTIKLQFHIKKNCEEMKFI